MSEVAPQRSDGPHVLHEQRSRVILGAGYPACVRFAELLARHGEERGLIGPRELPRLWTRHILNSAAVAPWLPESGSVADVGSGAGLPGIVLAAMRPDLAFHLIEPMERRAIWLREVIDGLGLERVQVHQVRAEELHEELFCDAVTVRAVAALRTLVPITMPLLAPGGVLLAQKGERAEREVQDARSVLARNGAARTEVHSVDLLDDGEVTRVVSVRAVA